MSLDKFKSIKTKIEIQTDAEYSKSLTELPEKRIKKPILATLSTVAAVMLIAVAVGMWALIGRGVRNNGNLKVPASEAQTYAITDEIKLQLENLYRNYSIVLLDDFDEKHPLTVEQVLKYCDESDAPIYDFDLTREEFSQFAKDTFNYDMEIPEDLVFELDQVHNTNYIVPEPVSFTVKDGVATATYQNPTVSVTVRYRYKDSDPFTFDYFLSVNTEIPEAKPDSSKKTMEDIAKQYHFECIHPFEEGELPYYVRYHISTLIDKSKIQQYWNKGGGTFLGIPYDDYKEAVTRLYGKDDMEGKEILEFSQMKSYEKYADLIRKDGELYVNLEIGGGMLDCEYEILDTQYKDGKVTVTFKAIEIGVDYGNSQPDTTILTYTSDDGLTPKQFISCLIATSEPLAPKDDIEYISEPEFLPYLPHYAFDVELDMEDYAWAEDGYLSENMTYGDLYADLWTFIKKYHFYGINVGDYVTLTEQNENTPIPRTEAEDILRRLEKALVVDNISLRFQSGNRSTIDGKSVDFFEATAFFELAKVIKVEYKAERPKNCHVLNITRVYGPTETGAYVNDNVYFTENQVYWNECLYTVTDDYFTGLLNILK